MKNKEKRLKSWRSTPGKYKWTFTIFVSGLIFMLIGNTGLIQDFSVESVFLFIIIYLILLITSWIVGEYFYRKRHRLKHQPLITIISEQLRELDEDKKVKNN